MKFYLLALLFLSSNAHAVFGCGYGNLYKDILCEASLSATYEAGYTEVYARQNFSLYRAFDKANIELLDLSGTMTRTLGSQGEGLELKLSRAVDGIGTQTTVAVSFPDSCNAEAPALSLYGKTVIDHGSYGTPMDLNIVCKAKVWFDKD